MKRVCYSGMFKLFNLNELLSSVDIVPTWRCNIWKIYCTYIALSLDKSAKSCDWITLMLFSAKFLKRKKIFWKSSSPPKKRNPIAPFFMISFFSGVVGGIIPNWTMTTKTLTITFLCSNLLFTICFWLKFLHPRKHFVVTKLCQSSKS